METVIETHNMAKRFGKIRAVDGLTLQVERGDVFGFLGPNGAGKSTTIRILVGLVKPNSGSACVFGCDTWRDRIRALRRVGSLVETPGLYKFLTGRENLSVISRMSGYRDGKIEKVLEMVGLAARAGDKVKNYSHGMKQRLAIAQCLIGDPELLILDEPTSGLDPEGMKEVRELIKKLSDEHKMTVFLSSHLLHEVQQICNKVAIVNQGKLALQGDIGELISGTGKYEIEVSNADKAATILDSCDWAELVSKHGSRLLVKLDSRSSGELNRLLVESDVDVNEIRGRERSLEDIYMSITGTENVDTYSD